MQVLDISRAAETLGISQTKLRQLISRGDLPAYKLGGSIRIRVEDLDLAYRRITPTDRDGGGRAA